jgi:hypothetical protein
VIALVLAEPLIALGVVIVLLAIGIAMILVMRKAISAALRKRRERKRVDRGNERLYDDDG